MKLVYVSPSVFDWDPDVSSWGYVPKRNRKREYAIWQHAANLLDGPDTHDARGDCIGALNRTIDLRAKKLDGLYLISKALGSKRHIDNLHSLGLLRRDMLLQINRIRNFFEHRDRKPPNFEKLRVYVELVWYFLRSTDSFSYLPRSAVQLSPSGMIDRDDDRVDIEYLGRSSSPWKISLALEQSSLYSYTPKNDWAELAFSNKSIRSDERGIWASDGRLVSQKYIAIVLGKFFAT